MASAEKTRLLAVDDNSDSAELIARVASRCGYEAQWMDDPRALVGRIALWRPEIVTLDLCMPQEDGVRLLALLSESGFGGKLVIISGQDDWMRKMARRLALAHGLEVVEDLGKPVDLADLRKLLSRLNTRPDRAA